jgi:polysaccharide export outer membrane protein
VKKAKPALLAVCCVASALLCFAPFALWAEEAAGAAEVKSESALIPVTDQNYRIAEEDILKVNVWGEPELRDIQMQVTPDGKVNLPYLGDLMVVGLTQVQLTKIIAQKFEDAQILLDPKIQVSILGLHRPRMRVFGEVSRPGDIEFKDGDRILDALAQAGSYTQNALLEKATLTHKGADSTIPIDLRKMLHGDLKQNYPLQKGDSLYIPQEDYQNKFYVFGQVYKPGIYSLREKTTLLNAISLAGGPTERGILRSTIVVRGDPAKPERVQCNLTRLFDKGDLSQDISLQSGDVVIVPETKRPDWAKVSQILGTVLNLSYLGRSGLF